ncbi:hypothetical protein BD309DRAFT_918566 [Dichomitus squalens]|uniref:Uncharacterized protein n=1 Tax=Dichomitus squalens TaxID=114155 RepID=A0A4Q9Q9W5_9APHY|nr:uncharacterized protein DICSQDRAFT_95519 [Dichomitus squalens LYAD-421 SS1]EJF66781.1 hypothetical protein DICSQDRAFT_95519 [Dichomitus squalens LYAD-421 SS1]TBU35345.1 hypothetical protein BD311DRAFT_746008 [Dichomitus squalens]TBU45116.1 hypothetical protein BD309DRAFT_918566 [Dichomitus squalens]TBU63856.1 hypothetical protein BD310DRAFT_841247 [Dichomitus squalens]
MADPSGTTASGATPDVATYDPKPSLQYASAVGLQAAGIGALVSAVQNALGTHSSGAAGFFTRTGGTIGFFAAMGATFALTESVVANQREVDDSLNGAAGGCAAGFLAGIRARSLPIALASCAVLGTAIGTLDYTGRNFAPRDVESIEERRKRFFKQPRPTPSPASDAE